MTLSLVCSFDFRGSGKRNPAWIILSITHGGTPVAIRALFCSCMMNAEIMSRGKLANSAWAATSRGRLE